MLKKLEGLMVTMDLLHFVRGKSADEVVDQSDNGQDLLCLAVELKVDVYKLSIAKALCAQTVFHLMTEVGQHAVETTALFGLGFRTKEQLVEEQMKVYYSIQRRKSKRINAMVSADMCAQYTATINAGTNVALFACSAMRDSIPLDQPTNEKKSEIKISYRQHKSVVISLEMNSNNYLNRKNYTNVKRNQLRKVVDSFLTIYFKPHHYGNC